MKKTIAGMVVLLVTILTGCSREVPAYVAADNSSTAQVDLFGDSAKEAGVYLNYQDGRLVPVLSWYSDRDSVNYISDVSISIKELSCDSISIVQGEFPGALKCVYFGANYNSLRDLILKDADSLATAVLSMQAQREYKTVESELKDEYTLSYTFTLNSEVKKGEFVFHKTTKTIVESMRFH